MHHASLHGMASKSNPSKVAPPAAVGEPAPFLAWRAPKDEAEVRPRFCGFAEGDAHLSVSPAVVQFWTEKLVGIVYHQDATAITWFADSPVT